MDVTRFILISRMGLRLIHTVVHFVDEWNLTLCILSFYVCMQ